MRISKTFLIIIAIPLVILGLLSYYTIKNTVEPGKYDEFAKCLTEKDVKFYGAFWCPHCRDQKNMFGSSQKYLPYIECSTPDGSGQLALCQEQGIQSYPTWEFPDGTRQSGSLSLQTLADKSGCALA